MIAFKISGQSYKFPTRWEDVTYTQYIYHIYPRSLSETISCFTGIPVKTLESAQIKGLEKINIALEFIRTVPHFERTKLVGPYCLPQDVTLQSLGQFEDLRALLVKMPKKPMEEFEFEDHVTLEDLYLSACAIYVQKIKDGKYDFTKVESVREELKGYSCAEVIGTGSFFLFRPLNISPPSMSLYRKLTTRLKRWSQALPGYQKTLDFLQRSTK
jgi:hypothetical protein